jgi:hypothetical protein
VPDAVSNTACLPHTPKVENDSIPIEHGPAQFNAFYPQYSGRRLVHFLTIYRRSIADRILDVIGSFRLALFATGLSHIRD